MSAGQQQGRRLWAELSGLMEAEHASLMDENQRLKRQMSETNSELQRARDQVRAGLPCVYKIHRRCTETE